MSSCKNCRHLISVIDEERITCEAHRYSVERDQECKAYLSVKCKDKKKIRRSNRKVEDILLEEYEDMLG
ncbi:hypothetical protein FMM74_020115 [Lachnospiraceae bacterium MD308]|nr:hypothetical protein [Lachnospiraceae bacterium MD308]